MPSPSSPSPKTGRGVPKHDLFHDAFQGTSWSITIPVNWEGELEENIASRKLVDAGGLYDFCVRDVSEDAHTL